LFFKEKAEFRFPLSSKSFNIIRQAQDIFTEQKKNRNHAKNTMRGYHVD